MSVNVNDGIAFWNALKGKIKSLIMQETNNCFRLERYDVTTAPNGTTIGVTLPEGTKEIHIPYSAEVTTAHVGDTVIVGWRGSLSNAKAVWFGNGYNGVDGSSIGLEAYPIGSIYMSVNSTNPSTLFGGTWVRLQDTFLLAAGSTYEAGSTGGEASHTLTETEIPSHTHGSKLSDARINLHGFGAGGNFINNMVNATGYDYNSNGFRSASQLTKQTGSESYSGFQIPLAHTHTSFGGSGAHNNMPPYLAVYMWKRTA